MGLRILIVDDHEVVRAGVRTLLAGARPDWEICGEAPGGTQAMRLAVAQRPDCIVLDVSMPDVSGLLVASRIRQLGLRCPILIFTMHESERLVEAVRDAGAQGYVRKSQAGFDLIRAIEIVSGGGTFFGLPARTEPNRGNEPSPGGVFCVRLTPAPA